MSEQDYSCSRCGLSFADSGRDHGLSRLSFVGRCPRCRAENEPTPESTALSVLMRELEKSPTEIKPVTRRRIVGQFRYADDESHGGSL